MNVLLDFISGARICGGFSELVKGESNGDICTDKLWDAFAATKQPPIPKVIEISLGSEDDDDDDLVSTISDADMIRAFTRYRDMMASSSHEDQKDFDHELHLLEIEPEDDRGAKKGDGSLACSSFDSRMGDSRFMTEKEMVYYDDGSSYSSYYFRRAPQMSRPVISDKPKHNTSWQTTSTRATASASNPRFPMVDNK